MQNRVAPDGQIIATRARGTFMGNRGRLHDDARRIVRRSASQTWLICLLEFKGRHREVMSPSSYTELFFLDEVTALAAGHRPCAECRRAAYRGYKDAVGADTARDLDRMLAASRRAPRTVGDTLPDGSFVTLGDNDFRLLWRGRLHRWTPDGYVDPIPVTTEPLQLVTPDVSVDALRRGYRAAVHPSAREHAFAEIAFQQPKFE